MRRQAAGHENFFIAKNRDSESAQHAFGRCRRVAATSIAQWSLNVGVMEITAAQCFPVILTIAGIAILRATCIVARMVCLVAGERVPRLSALLRQRFLKQDSVFLGVLVYSGCSAFRFPSARSE